MVWLFVAITIISFQGCDDRKNNLQETSGEPVNAKGPLSYIRLPEGFHIEIFIDDIPNVRAMTLGDRGTLFAGSRREGKVYAVPDVMAPGRKEVIILAENLDMPVGVAFYQGDLYVSAVDRILKFPDIESNLHAGATPVLVTDQLPSDRHHGWKFIDFGPDGKLYVPQGAPCNVCTSSDPRHATIMRMNPDGTGMEIFAHGVRNSVGFDWHPVTGELWFTDNGRDWMGDDLPPDELNRAYREGLHFGFPYCHGGMYPDPDYGNQRSCNEFEPPVQQLGAHVAALGMCFYRGTMFPASYRNCIFIAEHGSWNRSTKSGYRVSIVELEGNRAVDYRGFASGWEQQGRVLGRPVDVLELPDGSLLVSDDYAGKIYRIYYDGK